MAGCSRRGLLKTAALMAGHIAASALQGCSRPIVRVEHVIEVEKHVTRVVTEIVVHTVEAPPTPTPSLPPLPASTPMPAAVPRQVVVADVANTPWIEFVQRVTPAFEDLNPDTHIVWRSQSDWLTYESRVSALCASGSLGDILEAPLGALPARWQAQGVIRELDDLVADSDVDTATVFPGLVQGLRPDGALLGLPFAGGPAESLLIYDRASLAEAGIAEPTDDWTLDMLVDAATRLTRTTPRMRPARFGYALCARMPEVLPLLRLFGTDWLVEDGTRCAMYGPQAQEALRWIHTLIHDRHAAPCPAEQEQGTQTMFHSGQIAMIRGSLERYAELLRDMPDRELGASVYPQHSSTGWRASAATGVAYCITRTSQSPTVAHRWMQYMSSEEIGVELFLGGCAAPGCRAATWTDARVVERSPICAELAELAQTARPVPLPANLRDADCIDAWNRSTSGLLAGRLGPEECAARLCAEIDAALALPSLDSATFGRGPTCVEA